MLIDSCHYLFSAESLVIEIEKWQVSQDNLERNIKLITNTEPMCTHPIIYDGRQAEVIEDLCTISPHHH